MKYLIGNKMKLIIMLFLFTATMLSQSNQLTNYNRASEIDSLLNDIKNRLWTTDGHTQIIGTITGLQDALNAKQATLVSGTNIKSINGNSLLGSGDISLDSTSSSTRGWRYVSDYGAVGDGVTNDVVALRNAMLTGNNTLEQHRDTVMIQFDAGKTYYVGTSPQFFWTPQGGGQRPRYIHIEGNSSTIVTSDVSENYLFLIRAWTDAELDNNFVSIPNTYARGDEKIKVDTSISNNARKGDVLFITTSTFAGGIAQQPDWLINGEPKSEMAEILRVSNDTLTLVSPLTENFSAGDTTKMNLRQFAKVIMRNLNFKHKTPTQIDCGLTSHRAIDFSGMKDFLIENVTVDGFPFLGTQISNSLKGVINNYSAKDLDECASRGMNYGLLAVAVQDIIIINSNIHGGRHAIDIGVTNRMLSRNIIIANNVTGTPQFLSTSTIATHPGVRDIIIIGNKVYGSIGQRSTHNIIANNIVHGHYNVDGSGAGVIGISNSWNPTGGYDLIVNNVIDAKQGSIQILTGNEGTIRGSYVITGNKVRASNFVRFDSADSNATTQYVDNIVISNNVWEKGGSSAAPPVSINAAGPDSLVVNNFVFENNTIGTPTKTVERAIVVYGTNTNIDIKKMIIRNNSFFTNDMINVQSGALIRYLEITGNVLDADNGINGDTSPVLIGGTVTTLKHLNNTYMNLATSTKNVVSGTVTNWYRGLDILLNSTNWSLYGITATNGFSIPWVAD